MKSVQLPRTILSVSAIVFATSLYAGEQLTHPLEPALTHQPQNDSKVFHTIDS